MTGLAYSGVKCLRNKRSFFYNPTLLLTEGKSKQHLKETSPQNRNLPLHSISSEQLITKSYESLGSAPRTAAGDFFNVSKSCVQNV